MQWNVGRLPCCFPETKRMWALEERNLGATSSGPREQEMHSHLMQTPPPVTSHWLAALPMVPLEGQEKAIWFGIQS